MRVCLWCESVSVVCVSVVCGCVCGMRVCLWCEGVSVVCGCVCSVRVGLA